MEMHYDESLKRLREGRIQPSYTRRGLATNIPAATNTSDVNPSLPGFQGANDMTDDDMDITLAVLEDAYDITDDMDMGITLAGLEDANDMEFVEGEVVGIKYGFLQLLYMDGGSNYALIETVHPIKRDKTSGCAYYDRAEHRKRLNRVRLSDTISLAIEVPSIYKEHPTRINISWKH